MQAMKDRFGPSVCSVVSEVVRTETLNTWSQFAAQRKDRSIDALIHLLWYELCAPLGFEFTVEKRNDSVQFHCTKCPIFEYAKELGFLEWGFEFHCKQDPAIVEAFNPSIGFTQTKWLMKGDLECDHFYFTKPQPAAPATSQCRTPR